MDNNDILFSSALVALFKGVINDTRQPKIWNTIISNQIQIENYISKLGLTLVIQKQDGYAYLKQRIYENEEYEIPRLISKRQLGFVTSFLLVVLRKEFAELDRNGESERFILSDNEIIEKVIHYLKETTNEAKQRNDILRALKRVEEMGFVRQLKNNKSQYEILPLIRGFVDAQWLEDFNDKLLEYKKHLDENSDQVGEDDGSI